MLLGVTFLGLQIGFLLMVGAWVMMLMFLGQHPPPETWPREPFARWSRFMKGDGFPAEQQPRIKLIAWMFRGALILFAVAMIAFFAAGGPDALPPPPPR